MSIKRNTDVCLLRKKLPTTAVLTTQMFVSLFVLFEISVNVHLLIKTVK